MENGGTEQLWRQAWRATTPSEGVYGERCGRAVRQTAEAIVPLEPVVRGEGRDRAAACAEAAQRSRSECRGVGQCSWRTDVVVDESG